jgi:hypothetical protein
MVSQNGASSATEMRVRSMRTGAAALVSGRSRTSLGRLILSDDALLFLADNDDTTISMPLSDMAWIALNPRARQLTLQITMRGAVNYHLRVPTAEWVSTLRTARERALVAPTGGVHHQSVALAG